MGDSPRGGGVLGAVEYGLGEGGTSMFTRSVSPCAGASSAHEDVSCTALGPDTPTHIDTDKQGHTFGASHWDLAKVSPVPSPLPLLLCHDDLLTPPPSCCCCCPLRLLTRPPTLTLTLTTVTHWHWTARSSAPQPCSRHSTRSRETTASDALTLWRADSWVSGCAG